MMTDLEKYEAVNKTSSLEELANVIMSFEDEMGLIKGRTRNFKASIMSEACLNYKSLPKNTLTREFGIRQQAMYLEYYS